ncbi:MAG TPA: hypothetical protein VHD62_08000 [Opitutaceae bacterium]|nr:hypothetical protein [Opitutaceae bacterium]
MKSSVSLATLLGAALFAAGPAAPKSKAEWNFELTPRAFQSNPTLDMTVITEFTDAGRKLPAVTRQAPAYFVFHSAGYHAVGGSTKTQPMSGDDVQRVLQRSLAANGFFPAGDGHAPTLVIVYMWGPHTFNFDQAADAGSDGTGANATLPPAAAFKNIFDRAALVGGEKFAAELAEVVAKRNAASWVPVHALGTGTESDSADLGAAASVAEANAVMDPVKLFAQRSTKTQLLVQQAAGDCYYVVASAYDYRSTATKQKQLLWRTRMTVNLDGVAQRDALPTLIASAAPYFGREMAEAEVLEKKALPKGQVEIGEMTVVPEAAATAPAKKK